MPPSSPRLLFVSPPRRAAQLFAESARRHRPQWRFFSLKPPVRSIIARCGLRCDPPRRRLLPAAAIAAATLPGYKRGPLNAKLQTLRARIEATLARQIDEQGIDALLVWNGSGLIGASAVALARQRGMPVLFGENGYFADTLQLDPCGVNFASSATAVIRAQNYRGYHAPPMPEHADDARRIPVIKPSRLSRLCPELQRLTQAAAWSWLQGPPARLPATLPDGIPPYVFVPLQVCKDSQLLQYSPLIGNDFERLLDALSQALARLHPDWIIVVKPHPAEHRHVQRRYAQWRDRWLNLRFVTEPGSTSLIADAQAVVTINSTVGFEAIVAGKPVLTLGQNFYCFEPLVRPVASLDRLTDELDLALRTPPDTDARHDFLAYVRHEMLIDCGYRRLNEQQIARFAAAVDQRLVRAITLLSSSATG